MQENYEITYDVDYECDTILSVNNYHYRNLVQYIGWNEGDFIIASKSTVGIWKKKGLKIEKLNI
jgi:hypothetical protein